MGNMGEGCKHGQDGWVTVAPKPQTLSMGRRAGQQ